MSQTCTTCGKPLPADAPGGLCPACLLAGAMGSDPNKTSDYLPFEPPSVAELAALFPQLEIFELIGAGGMGAVYKARQPGLDRLVALKVLPRRDDLAFAERFTREARTLAKLNHPGIVTVFDFGQAGGLYYFVMEYIDGVNLRQATRANKLSPAEALAIVPQVCAALQFAHDAGVVHRDIKPENILLNAQGRVKIADFGLAKLNEKGSGVPLTHTHQVMGTVHYMAPEQWEKPAEVDHRADIYSLGVVFYELLTGELPLGRFPLPSEKAPIDVRLDEIVLRTLEKQPERRYQHASDVKTDVESVAGRTAVPKATPDPLQRKSRKLLWRIALPLAVLVLVATGWLGFRAWTKPGNILVDDKYAFRLGVSDPWIKDNPSVFSVPGDVRFAWEGPGSSCLVVFVRENKSPENPRELVDAIAANKVNNQGAEILAKEIRTVAGMRAAWMVAKGKGTGLSIDGVGETATIDHWVAIPRQDKTTVVVLMTCEAEIYNELSESLSRILETLRVDGSQTTQQRESNLLPGD